MLLLLLLLLLPLLLLQSLTLLLLSPWSSQTELRLEAVTEMGYSPETSPPSGEVLIRGPAVFSSYYKAEAMSRECIGG